MTVPADLFHRRKATTILLLLSLVLNAALIYHISKTGTPIVQTESPRACNGPGDLSFDGENQFHIAGWRSGRKGLYSLEFRTLSDSKGVLFVEFQHDQEKGDYLCLRLENGHLVLDFDAGHGLTHVSTDVLVSGGVCDNGWHRVSVERRENEAWLELDGTRARAAMPGTSRQINTNSGMYVGGLPMGTKLQSAGTDSRSILLENFRGCVRNFKLNGKLVVNPENLKSQESVNQPPPQSHSERIDDNGVPVVTAFSDNHYEEAFDLIGSIQTNMPGKKIIVYDLGLGPSAIDKMESLCQVKFRRFDFSLYPQHVKDLKTYAWKPIIVQEVLSKYDMIFWADASVRFNLDFAPLISHLDSYPIVGRHTVGKVTAWTDPRMLTHFGVNHDAISSFRMMAATLFLIKTTYQSTETILKPWVECALNPACISPPGSKLKPCVTTKKETDFNGCHRYDQSALNVIIFKALGADGKKGCVNDDLVNKLTVTVRHRTSDYLLRTCPKDG